MGPEPRPRGLGCLGAGGVMRLTPERLGEARAEPTSAGLPAELGVEVMMGPGTALPPAPDLGTLRVSAGVGGVQSCGPLFRRTPRPWDLLRAPSGSPGPTARGCRGWREGWRSRLEVAS